MPPRYTIHFMLEVPTILTAQDKTLALLYFLYSVFKALILGSWLRNYVSENSCQLQRLLTTYNMSKLEVSGSHSH